MIEDFRMTREADDTLGQSPLGPRDRREMGSERTNTGPGSKHDGQGHTREYSNLKSPRAKAYAIIGIVPSFAKIRGSKPIQTTPDPVG